MAKTAAIKLSQFIEGEMSGSDIVSEHGGGYDPLIGQEYRRGRSKRGNTYHLTAPALRDLAEFLDTMAICNRDGENRSGARSCDKHAEEALRLAMLLEAEAS